MIARFAFKELVNVYEEQPDLRLAGADGSRTHRRHLVPPAGVEVREAHRDLSAPLVESIYHQFVKRKATSHPLEI